jgi:hypothetical protein
VEHTLEECPNISSEYQDTCQECGDLSSCVCLASIVQEWEITPTKAGEGACGLIAINLDNTGSDLVANLDTLKATARQWIVSPTR